MNRWSFVIRNLFYHRRINLAVALGVAAATAVLTGALVVGSSMRYSLRKISLERLAHVDEVMLVDHFFREEMVDELKQTDAFQDHYRLAVPVIIYPRVSVQAGSSSDAAVTNSVFLIACDKSFWELDDGTFQPRRAPENNEIVINEKLALDLGISADAVQQGVDIRLLIRVPKPQSIHGDSALGQKQADQIVVRNLRVIEIVPNRGLARFGLHPTQSIEANAFVSLDQMQSEIRRSVEPRRRSREDVDQPEMIESPINAILIAGIDSTRPPDRTASEALQAAIEPKAVDLGLWINDVALTYEPDDGGEVVTAHRYFSLTSREMMLSPEIESIALEAYSDENAQSGLTYLANDFTVIHDRASPAAIVPIPFSTITAIDYGPAFEPTSAVTNAPAKPLSANGIALNEWAARDLGAQVGDTIRLTYFDPDTTDGRPDELTRDFVLEDILKFTERDFIEATRQLVPFRQPPEWINDPLLTPYVPGFTDAESIREEGILPFPTRDRMRESGADDDYWDRYGTTPKAFVRLQTGQDLWGSRFGSSTMIRIPASDGLTVDELERRLIEQRRASGEPTGFVFNPIKRDWIAASSGTTPFDALFLSLSFFIIVSAIFLIALLFRLGVEQRADQIGLLMAMGYLRRDVARLLALEGFIISAIGALLGIAGGIGYGRIMVYGLTTWWRGAIVTPFIEFYASGASLSIGYFSGVLVSILTIVLTLRFTKHFTVRELLAGHLTKSTTANSGRARWVKFVAIGSVVAALGCAIMATRLGGESQAMAFVSAGFLLLGAALLATWRRFRFGGSESSRSKLLAATIAGLARSNVARNAGRSTLTIGLVAVASFLIVAISSFRMQPTTEGTAGFDYIVRTNLPILEDIHAEESQRNIFQQQASMLEDSTILSFRYKRGDNASCNNPYQSSQPQILGVTPETVEYFDQTEVEGFAWAGSEGESDEDRENPWRLLFDDHNFEDGAIPVVIDKNTAMYSLKVYSVGSEFEFVYDGTKRIRFHVVGFLANTILQGSLLVSSSDLERLFPDTSGFQYFLIKTPTLDDPEAQAEKNDAILAVMRRQLGDEGFSADSTDSVLSELLAVQNAYLSTFQALGALGLLFGTFGLATVQVRNMLERRKELALMRAGGYSHRRLSWLIVLENSTILFQGLGIGVAAALFAVLPHMIFGDASVPWIELMVMLGIVVIVGFATSNLAIHGMLRAPILKALRGE